MAELHAVAILQVRYVPPVPRCPWFTGTQSTNLFGFPPFSIKHPQDNFSLQNVNRHPPKCKMAPPPICSFCIELHTNHPPSITFWRALICILEAKILLGVLSRKGGAPKKVGTLASPHWCDSGVGGRSSAIGCNAYKVQLRYLKNYSMLDNCILALHA